LLLLIGTLSAALALALTPLMRRAALSYGILDVPRGPWKAHRAPIPYLGGAAVYVSVLVSMCAAAEFRPATLGILLGASLVAMLGLFDDLHAIGPGAKLLGQLLATWALVKGGVHIQWAPLPEGVALTLTFLWVVGITNAMNFLDVSDGLCAGVAAVAGVFLTIVGAADQDMAMALPAAALTGALLGFLVFNWQPARIYLGDMGSLTVGFLLSALAISGGYGQRTRYAPLAALLIFLVPLLELVLTVLARLWEARSPVRGSNDHFAVQLRLSGWSPRGIALYGVALGAAGGALALALVFGASIWPLAPAALLCVGHLFFVGRKAA
jgi:UDP-GlcNAc:undecaprenyl-phosphate GlcNAc-1-phosphate transferase